MTQLKDRPLLVSAQADQLNLFAQGLVAGLQLFDRLGLYAKPFLAVLALFLGGLLCLLRGLVFLLQRRQRVDLGQHVGALGSSQPLEAVFHVLIELDADLVGLGQGFAAGQFLALLCRLLCDGLQQVVVAGLQLLGRLRAGLGPRILLGIGLFDLALHLGRECRAELAFPLLDFQRGFLRRRAVFLDPVLGLAQRDLRAVGGSRHTGNLSSHLLNGRLCRAGGGSQDIQMALDAGNALFKLGRHLPLGATSARKQCLGLCQALGLEFDFLAEPVTHGVAQVRRNGSARGRTNAQQHQGGRVRREGQAQRDHRAAHLGQCPPDAASGADGIGNLQRPGRRGRAGDHAQHHADFALVLGHGLAQLDDARHAAGGKAAHVDQPADQRLKAVAHVIAVERAVEPFHTFAQAWQARAVCRHEAVDGVANSRQRTAQRVPGGLGRAAIAGLQGLQDDVLRLGGLARALELLDQLLLRIREPKALL
ncbi:MAG: hypothetical protein GAK34_02523 [Delftia tsuruhatensis]|nr:MAG: hypothetical protein GAK34_02523 [Delftia tsuruhatensis]